ncbi:MAG: hypothetical protein N3E51_00985 [Candidatus Micrarchaeota archaeon]|nr:hypothetical protein [Candidatus Micrarchaeota archaeon]
MATPTAITLSRRQNPKQALEEYARRRKHISDYFQLRLFPKLEERLAKVRKIRKILQYFAPRRTDLKKFVYE